VRSKVTYMEFFLGEKACHQRLAHQTSYSQICHIKQQANISAC